MRTFTYEETKKIYNGALEKGLNADEVMNNLVRNGAVFEGIDMEQAKRVADVSTTMGERIKTGIQEKAEGIREAIAGEGEYADRSQVGRGVGATKEAFSAISGTVYNVLPEGARNTLDKLGGGIGKGIEFIADKISNNEKLQEFAVNNPQKLEEALKITADLGLISGEILGAEAVPAGAKVIQKGVKMAREGVSELASPLKRSIKSKLDAPADIESAVKSLNNSYKSAFVEDKVGINNKLTKLGNISKKSPDELVENLAKEGIAPEVEGKLAKFDKTLEEISNRQNQIAQTIDNVLDPINAPTTLDEFKQALIQNVKQTADPAELTKSLAEVERTIQSYRLKYGDTITPKQLNEIRISANKATKAFDRPIFENDVSNSIGDVARKRIDEIVPDEAVRNANAEWGRLEELKRTASVFNNQPINVGILGSQLGRLGGAVAIGGLAAPISGGGSLVLAGIAATYGGDFVASFLRGKKFSKVAQDTIKKSLQENPDILKELIDSASDANSKYLQKLLPAPTDKSVRVKIESGKTINLPKESTSTFEQKQSRQIQSQLKKSNP